MLSVLKSFKDRLVKLDWVLIGFIGILAAISLVTLASLSPDHFRRQVFWYVIFAFIVFLGSYVDWRWLAGQSWFRQGFYWVSVGLISIAGLQSRTIRGTKSWLVFGGFRFEPAELLKVALILLLAGFFARKHAEAWLGRNILISFFYAALPAAIVILHPDLGSALVILGIWFGFLLLSGFQLKKVLIIVAGFILVAILGWVFVLKTYQKDRVSAFINPNKDPLGASYNVIQSKVAIGSAGFWGKGFGQGTQSHLKFLPEAETDFVFAAFVEEWGIAGGFVLLLTFLLVIFRIIKVGLASLSNDYRFISLGVALVLVIHFFVNVGSNLGLTPVTGITFPMVSYGGSNLLTTAIIISIIQRIKFES